MKNEEFIGCAEREKFYGKKEEKKEKSLNGRTKDSSFFILHSSFLEYVAKDIIGKFGTDLSRTALVFPNKRASLFINEHLAREAGRPLWSPAYLTISDLFRRHSRLVVGDQLKLISDLHKCFVRCTGTSETLDHFFGWGQLMLSDFDDIDKNMADADKVFANVRDIHELDDISYLTEEQTEALKQFFSNFSEEHNSELKRRFLNLWSHFAEIYHEYNDYLEKQGLAYEGALYRKVTENTGIDFHYDRYIFVGFNLLQKVEQRLFDILKKSRKTHFYWDFDDYYMPHKDSSLFTLHSSFPTHEAGHYIAQYLQHYPNELDVKDERIYSNFNKDKKIRFIASSTEDMQARYISQWLMEDNRYAHGRHTAIVMCNEQLLPTIIHCLPEEVSKVNITTGYPLNQSPLNSLLKVLLELQTTGYSVQNGRYRLKFVNAVLAHPYMRYISPKGSEVFKAINLETKVYYPLPDQLAVDDGTKELFCGLHTEHSTLHTAPLEMVRWLMRLMKIIARNTSLYTQHSTLNTEPDPLFQEALFRTYTLLNRLSSLCESGDLDVDIVTMQRLIFQLTDTTSIPFHGEPAEGLQVMGMLETRNLDFDHVLLLSCNEGYMPKGVNNTSFIPYSIRKAYELTTIDHKVAIYAYYFYRLIQRAKDVTIIYNSTADETNTGEMSRFMLQMQVESRHKIELYGLKAGLSATRRCAKEIEKTPEVMQVLTDRFDLSKHPERDPRTVGANVEVSPLLTPSAINKYQRCPLQFFYNYLGGLYENEQDDEDTLDNRIFGNIFHVASQYVYEHIMEMRGSHITKGYIEQMLKDKVRIEQIVDRAFSEELFKINDDKGFRPSYNGLQIINRQVIITYLRQLLEIDMQLAPFDIIGLEKAVCEIITINVGDKTLTPLNSGCTSGKPGQARLSSRFAHKFETSIGGRIDRLDCVSDGSGEHIRIVDYKTGSRKLGTMKSIDDVFAPENVGGSKHADNYLQAMLYSTIVSERYNKRNLPVSPALLFIQHAGQEDYDPTLCINKERIADIRDYADDYKKLLTEKIAEIFNPDIPFKPTEDEGRCVNCPYKELCGM